jgi:S1-C subfamily serine protease
MAETLSGESFAGLWFGARLKPELNQLTVLAVQPGSPAEKAGLRVNDVIFQVDANPAGSLIDFNRTLVAAGTERALRLTVRREGTSRPLTLRLRDEAEFFNARLIQAKTGLTLKRLDRGGGFVVAAVDNGSPAARKGIRPGMFVLGFDGVASDDYVALAKAAYQKPKGEALKLELYYQQGWNRYRGEVEVPVR